MVKELLPGLMENKKLVFGKMENYKSNFKELPESIKQFGGLIGIMVIIFITFFILNKMFGEGDELVAKMKIEEERIAQERKLNKLISSLPSGILVSFDGTDHFKLSDELYEAVCKATKLIPQRAIMGANFLNFRAHEIYTINGNKIDETFVKWDKEKNKCCAGFVVSGNNVGVDETISVSGEALSFLSTGIDTRVYFIKNF